MLVKGVIGVKANGMQETVGVRSGMDKSQAGEKTKTKQKPSVLFQFDLHNRYRLRIFHDADETSPETEDASRTRTTGFMMIETKTFARARVQETRL